MIGEDLNLKPCPICGRLPKVTRDRKWEAKKMGARCIIECKPLFRKAHFRVEARKGSWDRALKFAFIDWNRSVKNEYI